MVLHLQNLRKEDIAPVFKLTDLALMYKAQFGVDVGDRIHTSRIVISTSRSSTHSQQDSYHCIHLPNKFSGLGQPVYKKIALY